MRAARIIGVGGYLPQNVVSNDDLAKTLDTSDEWISTRTGIKSRHFAADGETTSEMAVKAARRCLESADKSPKEVGMIIVSTVTGDLTFPSVAVLVQRALGVTGGAAFDVQAACAGFIYGLSIANNAIRLGECESALVVGAEMISKIINQRDRSTAVLFGDGAGAVLLQADEKAASPRGIPTRGILAVRLHADGDAVDILKTDGGVSSNNQVGVLTMNGREVFRRAVTHLTSVSKGVIADAGLSLSDVDWLIPHQANRRILDMVRRNLNIAEERVVCTIAEHANTSSASIPLALSHQLRKGLIKPGQLLLIQALGGGLAWGAAAVRW